MILYRRGFGLYDQQELAKYFKIKISKKDFRSFNIKLNVFTSKNYNEGLKTIESEKTINSFFKKNKIPLTAKAVRASEINDLKEFLVSNIKDNNDLWLEYKTHKIHGEKIIHDNVVESVKVVSGKGYVTLVDPYWEFKPRLVVGINKISEAISNKYGRETGFIVISKNNLK